MVEINAWTIYRSSIKLFSRRDQRVTQFIDLTSIIKSMTNTITTALRASKPGYFQRRWWCILRYFVFKLPPPWDNFYQGPFFPVTCTLSKRHARIVFRYICMKQKLVNEPKITAAKTLASCLAKFEEKMNTACFKYLRSLELFLWKTAC